MESKIAFAIIGLVISLIEAIIGLYFYFIEFFHQFVFVSFGFFILNIILFIIFIKTDYDPFLEFSCWAFMLSFVLLMIGIGYFPWISTISHRVFNSCVFFTWALYFSFWNVYAIIRKKEQFESVEQIN